MVATLMHKRQCKFEILVLSGESECARVFYLLIIQCNHSQSIKSVAEGMQAEARSIVTQMASKIEQQSRDQDRRSKQIEETMDRLEKAIYAINVSG